ncbi:MAG: SpoIIE family protein phosphatase [Pseudomonadota bacterium]
MGRLSCGLVHQPVIGETRSGDDYCVIHSRDMVLVAMADGLGHGPMAQAAAHRAIEYVARHQEQDPRALLDGCHRALRGTRGAVLAIVRIDLRAGTLVHAGLGNIETRIVAAERIYRPVTVNGIAGYTARSFRAEQFAFLPGDLLIMHTDGISDRFEISPAARGRDLQMLASQIVHEHGRHHDDQLLLILRYEP